MSPEIHLLSDTIPMVGFLPGPDWWRFYHPVGSILGRNIHQPWSLGSQGGTLLIQPEETGCFKLGTGQMR